MSQRRKLLAAALLAVAAAAAGCLDALAPGAPQRVARIGIVPLFESTAGQALPADVDSIEITIHNPNPPPADTTVGVRVEPGQDSIVISIEVPLSGAAIHTRTLSFAAIRSGDGAVLYSGTQDVVVRPGVPAHADSVRVRYVGPGQNIASLALAPSALVLKPGDAFSAWNVLPIDSTGATIVGMPVLWRSRDPGVAAVDASGLTRGVANGQTYVLATSGARSSVRDSALVVVATTPVAVIDVAPGSASFTAGAGGADPAAQTIAVTNGGFGPLTGLSVSGIAYASGEPTGWLTATIAPATAPAVLTLQAVTGTLAAGTYHATVSVASALASNSPQGVVVTFTVTANPTIALSSAAVTFLDTIATSDPAPATVSVTNTGGGSLTGLAVGTISYGSGSGWLTATVNPATAPATLTLTVAKGALAPGTYTATVPVTSPVAGNSPQTVAVTFTIAPAVPAPLARIVVTPGFGLFAPTGTLPLAVQGFDAGGGTVPVTGLRYLSRSPGVASVDSLTGVVAPTGGGSAVIVASAPGGAGTVYDSMLVAVAGSGVAVVFPQLDNGRAFGSALVGDTVHLAVAVYIGAVPGEVLGSYTAQLNWDPAVLRYVGAAASPAFAGSTTFNETATGSGQLRFGAADANGVPGPQLALVQIVFVAATAGGSPLTLAVTDLSGVSPTFTQMVTSALVLSTGVVVR